jgi:multidrug efflux pump subunit AcrA (membrane-fusion protein)
MTATDLNTVREALTYFDPKRFSVTINAARAALDRIEAELERARLISTPGGRSAAASSLELVAPGEQGLSYSWDDRDWQLTVELQQRRAEAAEAQVQQLKAAALVARSEIEWCIGFASTAFVRAWAQSLVDGLGRARAALADVKEEDNA